MKKTNKFMKKTNKLITWAISLSVATSGFVAYSAPAQATTSYNVEGLTLNFSNAVEIGTLGEVGFSYRYENVVTVNGQEIDAIVSIAETNSLDSDDNDVNGIDNRVVALDRVRDPGQDLGINTYIDVFTDINNNSGFATYRFEFVLDGTSAPVILENLSLYIVDIDGLQFAQFSGPQSYEMANDTELTVLTNSDRAEIPAGTYRFAELDQDISDSEDQPFWAAVKYEEATSIDITVGSEAGGGSFTIFFGPVTFSDSTVTTPTPTSYTISYDGNGSTSGSAPASTSGTGNLTVASTAGSLKKAGYSLASWNTKADGTGATLALGSSYRPTRDITLYAMWVEAPATETVKLSKIIYFNSASGKITKTALAQLKAFVAEAKALDSITDVSVYGYVQPTKSNTADMSLSRSRAKNTAAALKKLGIATINNAVGMGKAINKSGAKARYVKIVIRGTRIAQPV